MVTPSFAQATRSSTLKASPRKANPSTPEKSQRLGSFSDQKGLTPAKQLKRPSTLTRRARETIAYNADLHHITPANPSKLCPLAALPSELRSIIYSYTFGDLQRPILMNYGRIRYLPSALLQVCRAIRIEAAYMYFAEASFTWIIKNLNFVTVMRWLQNLQPSHRALLTRNRNLTIEVTPELRRSFTYPPKDFLLDDTMQNHWKACQPFGNLYSVTRIRTTETLRAFAQPQGYALASDFEAMHDNGKVYFILFCRLAAWSKLCTHPAYVNIEWNYTFDFSGDVNEMYSGLTRCQLEVETLLTRLRRLWTRDRCEDRIRQPILNLFDAFLEAFGRLKGSDGVIFRRRHLFKAFQAQRGRIEAWNR